MPTRQPAQQRQLVMNAWPKLALHTDGNHQPVGETVMFRPHMPTRRSARQRHRVMSAEPKVVRITVIIRILLATRHVMSKLATQHQKPQETVQSHALRHRAALVR